MSKIMLIAGCSHAAGSEIDGSEDSSYNREHSYGNQLAIKLGYKPINIAIAGSTNSGIARSVIEWYENNYKDWMELFVLVGWTDGIRLEAPSPRECYYEKSNPNVDWFSESSKDFFRVHIVETFEKQNDERNITLDYQGFAVRNENYVELQNAHYILMTQYYLRSKNIPFLMVNSSFIFTKNHKSIKFYKNQFDDSRYVSHSDNEESFYYRYKKAGYTNPKAKYRHHGLDAHSDYSECLKEYILENNLQVVSNE